MSHNTFQEAAPERQQKDPADRHAARGCLLRVYWMLLGNAFVALFAYGIVQKGGALTAMDIFYWRGADSLVITRYVDIRFLAGTTAEEEPATMKHWQRYSLRVTAAFGILWLIVHGLGYLSVVG